MPPFEIGEDLHDMPLGELRVYRAGCEAVLEVRCDEGINVCYQAVLDELEARGEL